LFVVEVEVFVGCGRRVRGSALNIRGRVVSGRKALTGVWKIALIQPVVTGKDQSVSACEHPVPHTLNPITYPKPA
jgi:hypothetical protein